MRDGALGSVPRLLERLERNDGLDSPGLAFDEQIVANLNARNLPGWGEARRQFAGGDRPTYRAHMSEFRLAYAMESSGLQLVRFGVPTVGSKNMDLHLRSGAGDLLLEVLAPTTSGGGADWPVLYTDELVEGLERVTSGLVVRLAGYRRSDPRPPSNHVDLTVERFVEALTGRSSFVAGTVLLSREGGDLVDITIECPPQRALAHTTGLIFEWGSGAFTPNLPGLVDKLLEKRDQLDPERASMVAADLVGFDRGRASRSVIALTLRDRLRDLGIAHLRLEEVNPPLPDAFGLFASPDSPADAATFWRQLIYARRAWKKTALGRVMSDYWTVGS